MLRSSGSDDERRREHKGPFPPLRALRGHRRDQIVRPLLIGKGVDSTNGVIGGILAFGFLGLFIGPTLLTVGYNLFEERMDRIKVEVA